MDLFFFLGTGPPQISPLFPHAPLSLFFGREPGGGARGGGPPPPRSSPSFPVRAGGCRWSHPPPRRPSGAATGPPYSRSGPGDRKSTRLNSSHSQISYAVFCLKKKKKTILRLCTKKLSTPAYRSRRTR